MAPYSKDLRTRVLADRELSDDEEPTTAPVGEVVTV